jgi:hypothetical protein
MVARTAASEERRERRERGGERTGKGGTRILKVVSSI